MTTSILMAATLTIGLAAGATAQEVVFLIRHAEKAAGEDPSLTEAGRARASRLAHALADAELDAVITSTASRTMETGTIISSALDLPIDSLPPKDIAGLIDLITFDYEDGRVLVVAHRETIPGILAALGHVGSVTIDENEFDRVFIVVPAADPTTVADLTFP
jgi:broad specificity phosphatase PhoE